MTSAGRYLSIVIPAFNESRRISKSLDDLKSFFRTFADQIEIIVVVEKSTDNTLQLALDRTKDTKFFKIIGNDVQKGKGYAVRTGMLRATGKYVFFMDLDLSTPLAEVITFLNHFESRPTTDILIGSRKHPESQILKKQNPVRQKMGQTFNKFVQFFAVEGIQDTQCGFKAFRDKTVKAIFSRQKIDGFSFDVEILLLAKSLGYGIEVLPVKWVNSPESKVRIVRDSMKMFIDLLRMKRLVKRTLRDSPIQKDEI